MDSGLHLIGIARKAGRVQVGEEPVGASARARQAKLIVLAADAAENTLRRAGHFAQAGNVSLVQSPYTKAELGLAAGRTSCAMLAFTDAGLAASFVGRLADLDGERYGEMAAALGQKAEKVLLRQKEQRRHEKNLQRGRAKPWAPVNQPTGVARRLGEKKGPLQRPAYKQVQSAEGRSDKKGSTGKVPEGESF